MPVLKVYHHGFTAGVPPTVNNHLRAKRGDVGGWSEQSIRSNTRFLYSVTEKDLTGVGYALTLTLCTCPQSHDDWKRLRNAYFDRLRRMGMVRLHWVTEWQRRGVPHLHAAVWFETPPEPPSNPLRLDPIPRKLIDHWISLTDPDSPRPAVKAQHVAPIRDSVGWFKYLSKHAARGLSHYQRSPEGIPPAWKNKTGRMWGHLGTWPTREAIRLELDHGGWFAFRRLIRRWRISQARTDLHPHYPTQGQRRRLQKARSLLTCSDHSLSAVRGLSEWMEVEEQLRFVAAVAAMGHEVQS